MISIGKHRNRIKIYGLSSTKDETGGNPSNYEFLFETWADVRPMKGGRQLEFAQISFRTPYEISLRFRADTVVSGDFDRDDFDPLDFYTSLTTNTIADNYKIVWRSREIILHSVVNDDDWLFKLLGYESK